MHHSLLALPWSGGQAGVSGGKDLEPDEAKPPEELAQGPRHTAALEEHEDTLALEGVVGIV